MEILKFNSTFQQKYDYEHLAQIRDDNNSVLRPIICPKIDVLTG